MKILDKKIYIWYWYIKSQIREFIEKNISYLIIIFLKINQIYLVLGFSVALLKKNVWILISLSKHSLALFVILKFKLNVYLTNAVYKKGF